MGESYGNPKTFWKRVTEGAYSLTNARVEEIGECICTPRRIHYSKGRRSGNYPHIRVGDVKSSVHRAVFLMLHPGADRSLKVLHRCDQPRCYRPSHLRLGTQSENMRECRERGRTGPRRTSSGRHARPGKGGHFCCLTEQDVRQVRAWLQEGHTKSWIARQLDVGRTTIQRIATGRTWKHVA